MGVLLTTVESLEAEIKSLRAEVARLQDHLHGCREEREAAEACAARAEHARDALRLAITNALTDLWCELEWLKRVPPDVAIWQVVAHLTQTLEGIAGELDKTLDGLKER